MDLTVRFAKLLYNWFFDWLPKQNQGGHCTSSCPEHCFSCCICSQQISSQFKSQHLCCTWLPSRVVNRTVKPIKYWICFQCVTTHLWSSDGLHTCVEWLSPHNNSQGCCPSSRSEGTITPHSWVNLTGFPPHLENLEKQGQTWKTWKSGGLGAKTWKNILKPGNFFLTSSWKSPRALIKKVSKKNVAQARGPNFFFVCLNKGLGIISFYWNFKNVVLTWRTYFKPEYWG